MRQTTLQETGEVRAVVLHNRHTGTMVPHKVIILGMEAQCRNEARETSRYLEDGTKTPSFE